MEYTTDTLISILGFIFVIPILMLSSTVHEYCHAYIATLLGDYTAKSEGRLTLNPLKHIDPIGVIAMIFVRIGWSKPVPINEYNFSRPVIGTALVSIAGPVSNLALAVFSAVLYRILSGLFTQESIILTVIMLFFLYTIWINISLAVFNLLPIPPLDGYRIARAFLPREIRYHWENLEKYSGIIFLLLISPITPLYSWIYGFASTIITTVTNFLIGV